MDRPRQQLWRIVELVCTVTVVAAVGWHFTGLLRNPQLWEQRFYINFGLVLVSALSYLLGLGSSGVFWHVLLRALRQRPASFGATLRAYYLGQLGRYVPGKVVGLVWRARLLTGPEVNGGVAILTV